jgi:hypothetical protein
MTERLRKHFPHLQAPLTQPAAGPHPKTSALAARAHGGRHADQHRLQVLSCGEGRRDRAFARVQAIGDERSD